MSRSDGRHGQRNGRTEGDLSEWVAFNPIVLWPPLLETQSRLGAPDIARTDTSARPVSSETYANHRPSGTADRASAAH